MNLKKGFTLIELLVVIGIIGILAAVVLVAVNPGRQFSAARDAQRRSDLYSITNALYQYATEHNGSLPNNEGVSVITDSVGIIGTNGVNLAPYLVPTYIAAIPHDPSGGTEENTLYSIFLDANGRIVASASSELNPDSSILIVR